MSPDFPSKFTLFQRFISSFICFTFLSTSVVPPSMAQSVIMPAMAQTFLPVPSPVAITPAFSPVLMRGVMIHPEDSLKFDFIIDRGQSQLQGEAYDQEANKLIKYFLASLTIPEKDMWVNLSPYEKDRIIPSAFGQTEMGRDLLAQDYLLKQLTASLLMPEGDLGRTFWERVRTRAKEKFGTDDVPYDTFNKIWIIPEEAKIYENEKGAFVVGTHLKVLLEEDYIALEANQNTKEHGLGDVKKEDLKPLTQLQTEVLREVIIPEIEKEVNEGETFANLRQIYYSMVLAAWYKQALKESLLGKIYVDKSKTMGVNIEDPKDIDKIYNQYVDAFKKGAAGIIKEDYNSATQEVISRKYVTGGARLNGQQRRARISVAEGMALASGGTLELRTARAGEIGTPVTANIDRSMFGNKGLSAAVLVGALTAGAIVSNSSPALAQRGFGDPYNSANQFLSNQLNTLAALSIIWSNQDSYVRPNFDDEKITGYQSYQSVFLALEDKELSDAHKRIAREFLSNEFKAGKFDGEADLLLAFLVINLNESLGVQQSIFHRMTATLSSEQLINTAVKIASIKIDGRTVSIGLDIILTVLTPLMAADDLSVLNVIAENHPDESVRKEARERISNAQYRNAKLLGAGVVVGILALLLVDWFLMSVERKYSSNSFIAFLISTSLFNEFDPQAQQRILDIAQKQGVQISHIAPSPLSKEQEFAQLQHLVLEELNRVETDSALIASPRNGAEELMILIEANNSSAAVNYDETKAEWDLHAKYLNGTIHITSGTWGWSILIDSKAGEMHLQWQATAPGKVLFKIWNTIVEFESKNSPLLIPVLQSGKATILLLTENAIKGLTAKLLEAGYTEDQIGKIIIKKIADAEGTETDIFFIRPADFKADFNAPADGAMLAKIKSELLYKDEWGWRPDLEIKKKSAALNRLIELKEDELIPSGYVGEDARFDAQFLRRMINFMFFVSSRRDRQDASTLDHQKGHVTLFLKFLTSELIDPNVLKRIWKDSDTKKLRRLARITYFTSDGQPMNSFDFKIAGKLLAELTKREIIDSAMLGNLDFRTTEGKRIKEALISLRETVRKGSVGNFSSRFNNTKGGFFNIEGVVLWKGRITKRGKFPTVNPELDPEYMALYKVIGQMTVDVGEFKRVFDEELNGDGTFTFKAIGIAPKLGFDAGTKAVAVEGLQRRMLDWINEKLGDSAMLAYQLQELPPIIAQIMKSPDMSVRFENELYDLIEALRRSSKNKYLSPENPLSVSFESEDFMEELIYLAQNSPSVFESVEDLRDILEVFIDDNFSEIFLPDGDMEALIRELTTDDFLFRVAQLARKFESEFPESSAVTPEERGTLEQAALSDVQNAFLQATAELTRRIEDLDTSIREMQRNEPGKLTQLDQYRADQTRFRSYQTEIARWQIEMREDNYQGKINFYLVSGMSIPGLRKLVKNSLVKVIEERLSASSSDDSAMLAQLEGYQRQLEAIRIDSLSDPIRTAVVGAIEFTKVFITKFSGKGVDADDINTYRTILREAAARMPAELETPTYDTIRLVTSYKFKNNTSAVVELGQKLLTGLDSVVQLIDQEDPKVLEKMKASADEYYREYEGGERDYFYTEAGGYVNALESIKRIQAELSMLIQDKELTIGRLLYILENIKRVQKLAHEHSFAGGSTSELSFRTEATAQEYGSTVAKKIGEQLIAVMNDFRDTAMLVELLNEFPTIIAQENTAVIAKLRAEIRQRSKYAEGAAHYIAFLENAGRYFTTAQRELNRKLASRDRITIEYLDSLLRDPIQQILSGQGNKYNVGWLSNEDVKVAERMGSNVASLLRTRLDLIGQMLKNVGVNKEDLAMLSAAELKAIDDKTATADQLLQWSGRLEEEKGRLDSSIAKMYEGFNKNGGKGPVTALETLRNTVETQIAKVEAAYFALLESESALRPARTDAAMMADEYFAALKQSGALDQDIIGRLEANQTLEGRLARRAVRRLENILDQTNKPSLTYSEIYATNVRINDLLLGDEYDIDPGRREDQDAFTPEVARAIDRQFGFSVFSVLRTNLSSFRDVSFAAPAEFFAQAENIIQSIDAQTLVKLREGQSIDEKRFVRAIHRLGFLVTEYKDKQTMPYSALFTLDVKVGDILEGDEDDFPIGERDTSIAFTKESASAVDAQYGFTKASELFAHLEGFTNIQYAMSNTALEEALEKPTRIAINGFGAIGRDVLRADLQSLDNHVFVALNDLVFKIGTPGAEDAVKKELEKLQMDFNTKPGSQLKGVTVSYETDGTNFWMILKNSDGTLLNDGVKIKLTSIRDVPQLPWKELEVGTVVESTGLFREESKAAMHLAAGAQKVIISAPGEGKSIKSITPGATGKAEDFLSKDTTLYDCASCTTNSLSGTVGTLLKTVGIERYILNTVHSYTQGQSPLDDDIQIEATGAAKALQKLYPQLVGKGTGKAQRVPTINGSLSMLTFVASQQTTKDEINRIMKEAAEGPLKGILRYREEGPARSKAILGTEQSGVFQADQTEAVGDLVTIYVWYDNEFSYANRVVDLVTLINASGKREDTDGIKKRERPPSIEAIVEETRASIRAAAGADAAMIAIEDINQRAINVLEERFPSNPTYQMLLLAGLVLIEDAVFTEKVKKIAKNVFDVKFPSNPTTDMLLLAGLVLKDEAEYKERVKRLAIGVLEERFPSNPTYQMLLLAGLILMEDAAFTERVKKIAINVFDAHFPSNPTTDMRLFAGLILKDEADYREIVKRLAENVFTEKSPSNPTYNMIMTAGLILKSLPDTTMSPQAQTIKELRTSDIFLKTIQEAAMAYFKLPNLTRVDQKGIKIYFNGQYIDTVDAIDDTEKMRTAIVGLIKDKMNDGVRFNFRNVGQEVRITADRDRAMLVKGTERQREIAQVASSLDRYKLKYRGRDKSRNSLYDHDIQFALQFFIEFLQRAENLPQSMAADDLRSRISYEKSEPKTEQGRIIQNGDVTLFIDDIEVLFKEGSLVENWQANKTQEAIFNTDIFEIYDISRLMFPAQYTLGQHYLLRTPSHFYLIDQDFKVIYISAAELEQIIKSAPDAAMLNDADSLLTLNSLKALVKLLQSGLSSLTPQELELADGIGSDIRIVADAGYVNDSVRNEVIQTLMILLNDYAKIEKAVLNDAGSSLFIAEIQGALYQAAQHKVIVNAQWAEGLADFIDRELNLMKDAKLSESHYMAVYKAIILLGLADDTTRIFNEGLRITIGEFLEQISIRYHQSLLSFDSKAIEELRTKEANRVLAEVEPNSPEAQFQQLLKVFPGSYRIRRSQNKITINPGPNVTQDHDAISTEIQLDAQNKIEAVRVIFNHFEYGVNQNLMDIGEVKAVSYSSREYRPVLIVADGSVDAFKKHKIIKDPLLGFNFKIIGETEARSNPKYKDLLTDAAMLGKLDMEELTGLVGKKIPGYLKEFGSSLWSLEQKSKAQTDQEKAYGHLSAIIKYLMNLPEKESRSLILVLASLGETIKDHPIAVSPLFLIEEIFKLNKTTVNRIEVLHNVSQLIRLGAVNSLKDMKEIFLRVAYFEDSLAIATNEKKIGMTQPPLQTRDYVRRTIDRHFPDDDHPWDVLYSGTKNTVTIEAAKDPRLQISYGDGNVISKIAFLIHHPYDSHSGWLAYDETVEIISFDNPDWKKIKSGKSQNPILGLFFNAAFNELNLVVADAEFFDVVNFIDLFPKPQYGDRIGWKNKKIRIISASNAFKNPALRDAMTVTADSAVFGNETSTPDETRGGIDLNSASMNMQIQRDGNGVPLPVNLQNLENINVQGFQPIIINVVPITNLPLLLGLKSDAADEPVESSRGSLSVADRLARNPT